MKEIADHVARRRSGLSKDLNGTGCVPKLSLSLTPCSARHRFSRNPTLDDFVAPVGTEFAEVNGNSIHGHQALKRDDPARRIEPGTKALGGLNLLSEVRACGC